MAKVAKIIARENNIPLSKVLKEYPRESYFLTDKFPGFNTENLMKVEEIFNNQLQKCQTDYFDFYLLHAVSEDNMWVFEEDNSYDYLLQINRNFRKS